MSKKKPIHQFKKKNYFFPIALLIVLMAGVAYCVAFFWQDFQDSGGILFREEPGTPTDTFPQSSQEISASSSEPEKESEPESTSEAESEQEIASESEAETENAPETESDPGDFHPPREDYPYALAASEKVPNSYFDDAIFFGDSISTGIMNYNVMPNADVMAFIGISTVNALTKECIETDDGIKTMLDAAALLGDKKKVYIMLGGNGLGYDKETFINSYKDFISAVREQYPSAQIYVQTMPPVTDNAHKTYPAVNNEVINEYNLAIHDMAKNIGVYLVDSACAFMGEDGKLPEAASPVDGMHFGPEYYHRWFEYLKTHTAK